MRPSPNSAIPRRCCANTVAGSSSFARRSRRSAASCSRARKKPTSLGAVSAAAWSEFGAATADLEHALRTTLDFRKINYLALMMVDLHVHFHVIPRYSESREFEGTACPDVTWPRPPDVTSALPLSAQQMSALHARLHAAWPRLPGPADAARS